MIINLRLYKQIINCYGDHISFCYIFVFLLLFFAKNSINDIKVYSNINIYCT